MLNPGAELSPQNTLHNHFLQCCIHSQYSSASLILCTLKRGAIDASHILLESRACDNRFTPIPHRTAFFLRNKKYCLTGTTLFDSPLMWLISASCARGGPPSSPDS